LTETYLLDAGAGRTLDLYDVTIRIKTDSRNGAFSLIEGVWQPGGFGPLAHIHKDEDESFYVLDGQFDFRVGEKHIRAETGAFLFVPRGTLHSFAAAGESPARLMFIHAPPLEGFFLELAELAKKGPPDPEKIGSLMGRWGMEAVVA
jgi:quercetin dioxygenase-like cupin family protein